jgi:hypothetical protein
MKRQNKQYCCPDPEKPKNLKDDGKCEIDLKKKQWSNYTLFLDNLTYGGSCTYEVKVRCGFPKLIVNNSNIDMIVAYKRKEWGNDTYDPKNDDKYDDNETFNPKPRNGVTTFWLQRREKPSEKKDDHDDDKENECKEAKIYMTLTNLLNPNRPKQNGKTYLTKESENYLVPLNNPEDDPTLDETVYQEATPYVMVYDTPEELKADNRFVQLLSTAADEGAPDSALKVAFSAVIAAVMISLAYLF